MSRVLSKRQVRRVGLMLGLFALVTGINLGVNAYVWNGKSFDKKNEEYFGRGRIVEFSNQDEFCHSWFSVGALSL